MIEKLREILTAPVKDYNNELHSKPGSVSHIADELLAFVVAAEKAIPEMICTCSRELLCGRCNLYEALAKLKGDV
jgi:hypothetical protein